MNRLSIEISVSNNISVLFVSISVCCLESGYGHVVHYRTIAPSCLGRWSDDAMMQWWWRDGTTVRWRCCDDTMSMVRCYDVDEEMLYRIIVIASSHHRYRVIAPSRYRLFCTCAVWRKWRQVWNPDRAV